jgi:hypothetical protein
MAILLRPNPEAFNFLDAAGIARTEANGSIIIATCQLTTDLKNYGLWDKMKAIYPFVGGTSGSHKFNLKDPRDLDDAFRLVFAGSWIHSSTGVTPDGSTGYADTKFNPYAQLSLTNQSYSIYKQSNTTSKTYGCSFGYIRSSDGRGVGFYERSSTDILAAVNTDITSGTIAGGFQSTGCHYLMTRTNTSFNVFRNSTKILSTTSTAADNTLGNMSLGARNDGVNPVRDGIDTPISFFTAGDGLTDTDASNLYTAVQRFQTTLGRQV